MGDVVSIRGRSLEEQNARLRIEIGRLRALIAGHLMGSYITGTFGEPEQTLWIYCDGCHKKVSCPDPHQNGIAPPEFEHDSGCSLAGPDMSEEQPCEAHKEKP